MTRRMSLPGAAELFRATSPAGSVDRSDAHHPGVGTVAGMSDGDDRSLATNPHIRAVEDRTPSGRERHDEKITVYCSPAELIGLESARLRLRAEHGLAVDRGRIVREAMAVVLADLDAKGESSILVRRLREA